MEQEILDKNLHEFGKALQDLFQTLCKELRKANKGEEDELDDSKARCQFCFNLFNRMQILAHEQKCLSNHRGGEMVVKKEIHPPRALNHVKSLSRSSDE